MSTTRTLNDFMSPEGSTHANLLDPVGQNDVEFQEKLRLEAEAAATTTLEPTVEPALVLEEPVVEEPVSAVEPPPPLEPPTVIPAVPEPEDNGPFTKTKDGWEIRVKSLVQGGQDQVYKGKTQKEVASKMVEAQASAQRRIHELDKQKRMKNILLEPEVLGPVPKFEPKALTPDERFQLTNDLNDPAKSTTATRRIIEAELGASLETVRSTLQQVSLTAEENRARAVAREWANTNPDFYNSQNNIDAIANFFKERGWSVTTKNLDIAFSFLDAAGALQDAPVIETISEVDPPLPTATVPSPAPPIVPDPASPLPAKPPVYRPAGPSSTGITRDATTVRVVTPSKAPALVLSAEDYWKIPSAEAKRRYRSEPAFTAAVDALIAAKKI